MNKKHYVGDVQVIRGEPPEGNPYRGNSLIGADRRDALRKFAMGLDTSGYTFWYAPCSGGAKRCAKDEVDWESSSISVGGPSNDRRI
jgi:hypothetical protein